MEFTKDIIVLYHAHCPDGFGAAWSAWKKFGDSADYCPISYSDPVPTLLENKEIYIVDFCIRDGLKDIEKNAKKLVVIDHHESSKQTIESLNEYVFDMEYSGAFLSWNYFNKDMPIPTLINYLNDGDLNKYELPHAKEIIAYIDATKQEFGEYEKIHEKLSTENGFNESIHIGSTLLSYRDKLMDMAIDGTHFISFEGQVIPAVNVTLPINEKSELAKKLYKKYPHMSLTYRYDEGYWKCSLRSDGTINVADLAKKYGGGGHPGAAGFSVKTDFPLPFAELKWASIDEKDKNTA